MTVQTHHLQQAQSKYIQSVLFLGHQTDFHKGGSRHQPRVEETPKAIPPQDTSPLKFNMRELRRTISKMKAKRATGLDNIPPSFLKVLGPKALSNLLDIFNSSFYFSRLLPGPQERQAAGAAVSTRGSIP